MYQHISRDERKLAGKDLEKILYLPYIILSSPRVSSERTNIDKMNRTGHHPNHTPVLQPQQVLRVIFLLGFLASTVAAQAPESATVGKSDMRSAFIDLCGTIAPYCGVICFLAPLPTIHQISREKTVGNYPLLPYSSMVCNCFVWVEYGILKGQPKVWASNGVGLALGLVYCVIFQKHCSPTATNLPGTFKQHLHVMYAIILSNILLTHSGVSNTSELIGKEGVIICIILFASPLAALKHVIVTRSASSIPLPFTLACFVNCTAWSVLGWYTTNDFNIYFPNLLGLSCAVAQLVLKGLCGNRAGGLPK
jgi:solute carrier family 50 protein (sugar transporter)